MRDIQVEVAKSTTYTVTITNPDGLFEIRGAKPAAKIQIEVKTDDLGETLPVGTFWWTNRGQGSNLGRLDPVALEVAREALTEAGLRDFSQFRDMSKPDSVEA